MAELKFYRGIVEKYNQEIHGDGLYFATNTFQIIHNGQSYGVSSQIDFSDYATKDFIRDSLCGYVKDLTFSENTGEFTYIKKEKTSRVNETTGETIEYYVDKEVSFSIRGLVLGVIKDLHFENNSDGRGILSYTKVSEKSEELETGGKVTSLVDEYTSIELPTASYEVSEESTKYSDGLMAGRDKEMLINHEGKITRLTDSLTWQIPSDKTE